VKRTASATVVSIFAFSALIFASSVSLATANPAPLFPFPWGEPVTTPPTIVVYSPVQNQTYSTNEIWLNFTIIKPETWFPSGHLAEMGYVNAVFGNVTTAYYTVDGGQRQNITVHDTDTLFTANSPHTLNVSTLLTMTEGAHSLKVSLEADSYCALQIPDQGFGLKSIVVHNDSETVNFTIFPTSTVVFGLFGAAATVAAVSMLIHLKKHKREAKPS
jgi:hypothetical protein